MSKLAMSLGFFYILLGLTVAVSPEWFLSVVDWPSRQGLYVSAGIRVIAGVVLLLAAPTSKFPRVFRVIGAIALVAGLLLLFFPVESWDFFMRWWIEDNLPIFRTLLAVGGTLAGVFIAYAAGPKSTAD